MPELPEVETVRTGLDKALRGTVIEQVRLTRTDLRIPFPKDMPIKLAGRRIERIGRRAKYLLWHLDSEDVLIAHLGMSGRFSVVPGRQKPVVHDHVILSLNDGRQVIYNDARRFGLMTLAPQNLLHTHDLFAHLGPEPLEKAFAPAYLADKLAARKCPVKAALMDQEVVVGVGNIYASEALFLAGIHPLKPAYKTIKKAPELVQAICRVLRLALDSGGSSLRDFVHVSGESGYFQHRFNVYGRKGEPCVACNLPIENVTISGRSSFFCKRCQK